MQHYVVTAKLWERSKSMAKTKTLTEILKRLGVDIQATRPALKSKRPSMKPDTKVVKPKAATTPKADTGPKLSVPSRTKGRKNVQATTPSIQATRPTLKAKPKVSRATGRKKSTAVVPAPSTAMTKKPSTALVPITGSRAVTGSGTKVGSTMKSATRTPQARIAGPKRSKVTPPVTPASKLKKGPAIAAGLLGAGALTGAMLNKKDKAQAAPSKPSGPSTRGSNKPKVAPKATPKTAQPSGPSTRGSSKQGATKRISAGPNTGFGPKGNIFPGSSEERAAYMKMYGGTGSAAANAAAAGKQGNMEAGRKELNAAKKKRLSKPVERKSGGSVVARQVKGFGAARRPKK